MMCIRCDQHGETSCEHAEVDVRIFGFVCKHPCAIDLGNALRQEAERRRDAELKLEKYRRAIMPFVDNCRAVLKAVDDEKEGGEA